MAFANDLLEQALHLAKRERKRPRQASLRRAISTAYYALFHLLITDAVSLWRITSQRPALARLFEHKRMKDASARAANSTFAQIDPVVAAHLRSVASAFKQLYEDRHTADYDNATQWSSTEVVTQIGLVQQAFASWKAIRDEDIANDYLLSLFVKDRQ
jgi:uncharacterized protein (UPF0332 family)